MVNGYFNDATLSLIGCKQLRQKLQQQEKLQQQQKLQQQEKLQQQKTAKGENPMKVLL